MLIKIFKYLGLFIISLTILIAVYGLIDDALNRDDLYTCYKYQTYAREFPDFWVSALDYKNCADLGIKLDTNIH